MNEILKKYPILQPLFPLFLLGAAIIAIGGVLYLYFAPEAPGYVPSSRQYTMATTESVAARVEEHLLTHIILRDRIDRAHDSLRLTRELLSKLEEGSAEYTRAQSDLSDAERYLLDLQQQLRDLENH